MNAPRVLLLASVVTCGGVPRAPVPVPEAPPDAGARCRAATADEAPAGFVLTFAPDGVIVPEGEAALFYEAAAVERNVDAYWTPRCEQVAALERSLAEHLAGAEQGAEIAGHLAVYRRQYVGIVEQGKRWIWVNAFCQADGLSWRAQPVEVEDGGACYFRIDYAVDDGRFEELDVNGG